jgi:hypothetical protein
VQHASRPARRLLAVLFAAGLLILLDQSADLIATLLSREVALTAPNWRFGIFGLVASRTSALLAGDVMLFASATALGWRRALRALGAVHLLLAAGGMAALVLFVLDWVQVRAAVPAQSAGEFSAAAFRAGVVALGGVVTFAWAGVAAWRTAAPRPRTGHGAESLLVTDTKESRGR